MSRRSIFEKFSQRCPTVLGEAELSNFRSWRQKMNVNVLKVRAAHFFADRAVLDISNNENHQMNRF